MKNIFQLPLIIGLMAAGAILANTKYSFTQETSETEISFFCGMNQGILTTLVRTPRGNLAVKRWIIDDIEMTDATPQKQCEEVSERFQVYYNKGELAYITTGIMNDQAVVCTTYANGSACNGFLFALEDGQNAHLALQQLFPASDSWEVDSNDNSLFYIDVDQYLETTPTEQASNHHLEVEIISDENN